MTIVSGEIETLKRLKSALKKNGIDRFDSIASIDAFLISYPDEKGAIVDQVEDDLNVKVWSLQQQVVIHEKEMDNSRIRETEKLHAKIRLNEKNCNELKSTSNSKGKLLCFFLYLWLQVLTFRGYMLKRNFERIIKWKTRSLRKAIKTKQSTLVKISKNKAKIIEKSSRPLLKEMEHTKAVIDGLSPLIAGVVGEQKVCNALSKLSDDHTLINDFSLRFKPPIYQKKKNDAILSIQIDHLLISRAGVFIIETKNWSKKSLESLDLRSPVDQVRRSGYALFVLLNGDRKKRSFWLKKHPWGKKKIPIRNVIAMAGHKPKEQFKYATIKQVDELVDYINYFEPIFDEKETNEISQHLERMNFDGRP